MRVQREGAKRSPDSCTSRALHLRKSVDITPIAQRMTPSSRRRADSREPYLIEVQLRREHVRSFDEYPYSLPVVRSLHAIALHPAVTFLVGENGSGKSTLLEAIAVACGFNAEGGSRNFNFATRASHSALHAWEPGAGRSRTTARYSMKACNACWASKARV
jgi:ATPase subunit of ABC transporter with duplicated ATPase domains